MDAVNKLMLKLMQYSCDTPEIKAEGLYFDRNLIALLKSNVVEYKVTKNASLSIIVQLTS